MTYFFLILSEYFSVVGCLGVQPKPKTESNSTQAVAYDANDQNKKVVKHFTQMRMQANA